MTEAPPETSEANSTDEVPVLALSPVGVAKASSIWRTKVYELLASGKLPSWPYRSSA